MMKWTEMLNGLINNNSFLARFLAFGWLVIVTGCARDTVRVTGVVLRIRGNQMPSPDLPDPVYPGFKTTIYFYQPLTAASARPVGQWGMFSIVNGQLAGTAASNDQGTFKIRLKPGRYSVLIGNDGLYYANIRDGSGVLNPVEIPKGKSLQLRLRADWDATY
jgi:hypothetical protein